MQPIAISDRIILSPQDIDQSFRPVARDTGKETYILGTFNPGMTRLKNGNILLVVRVAETLKKIHENGYVLSPRFDPSKKKFVIDKYPRNRVSLGDPRHFDISQENGTVAKRLTSISWLLPVEIDPDNLEVKKVHYDKIILPKLEYQEYGLEDPRIVKIRNTYWMNLGCVSAIKLCTALYESKNGIDYKPKGVIFDHQNKDVVIIPKRIKGKYLALTRPEGAAMLAYPYESEHVAGKFISAASSPDLLHWKPVSHVVMPLSKESQWDYKLGTGAPPILVTFGRKEYWLEIFHGVQYQSSNPIGIYRAFIALLDKDDPSRFVKIIKKPFIESNPELKKHIKGKPFLDKDVVFVTGIIGHEDNLIVCAGELDTAVRLIVFSKESIRQFLR